MLNQVVLVGRIMDIKDNVLKMNIPERDAEDIRVNVELTEDMANNMKEYVAVGDLVGVKGKIANNARKGMKIKASKITFLSSKGE